MLDTEALREAMRGCDTVFHLQANADVRHGLERTRVDLEQNTIATSNVLEAMRETGATTIAFSSTGSVYGEPEVFPTPEDAPFPVQTSLYAASKLAGEGLIGAYCHGFGITRPRVPVRLDPRRALHARPRDRLLPRAARRPDDAARARRRPPAQELPVRAGLRERDPDRAGAPTNPGFAVYNLGTDESIVVDESIGGDHRPPRCVSRCSSTPAESAAGPATAR